MIEMAISSKERKIMLQDKRGNPDVIGWNRSGLRTQLLKNSSIPLGRLFVGVEHSHPRRIQKTREYALIGAGS
jgi:hypothetical protein